MLAIYLRSALLVFGMMVALWVVSLAKRDSSIVDIFWGTGFILIGWYFYWMTPQGDPARKLLLMTLVILWGLRLSLYVAYRNVGKGEDYRYQRWRQQAGSRWWWQSFFKVFMLQGLLMWLISAPLLTAQQATSSRGLLLLDNLAVVVWGIGFFFETVGDYQLARFKRDPANDGRLLTSGVWRFSRHPNYFGDAVQWWGFYLLAAAAGGWMTIFSPLLMTFLLVRVSGVALLEKDLKDSKPGYGQYVERTSSFIPWLPKKGEAS